MKKHLLSIIFLGFFFPSLLLSQNHDLIIGIEFGAGIRSLKGEFESLAVGEVSTGKGMAVGMGLQKYLSNDLSIKTSLLVAHKGARSLWEEFDRNGNLVASQISGLNFTYIQLPILFRFEFGIRLRYFLNVGPYVSSLIAHPHSRTDPNLDFTDNFSSLDWGMSSGFGCQVPINEQLLLTCELRNDLGFHDMSEYSPRRITYGPMKTRATNFLFGVSWQFE